MSQHTDDAPGGPEDYADLLARVRQGEAPALQELLERAQRIARRYSEAVCGRAPDTEDAEQEALLRTFLHAADIRDPLAFRAWLYRTVKNACLLGRRRPASSPAELQSLDDDDAPAGRQAVADVVMADERLLRLESQEHVRAALDALSPSFRELVFLRDLEGLSTREVAGVLGISEANVKVRLHRAHARLRRLLAGTEPVSGARASSSRNRRSP